MTLTHRRSLRGRYGGCSTSTLAVALLYLRRLKVLLTPSNLQRLFAVAVLEAVKMWDDVHYPNMHWAAIAGISVEEVNLLEGAFLELMNWKMFVTKEEYDTWSATIFALATRCYCEQHFRDALPQQQQRQLQQHQQQAVTAPTVFLPRTPLSSKFARHVLSKKKIEERIEAEVERWEARLWQGSAVKHRARKLVSSFLCSMCCLGLTPHQRAQRRMRTRGRRERADSAILARA
eukprot:3409419-Rhodomonas_salina.1